MSEFSDWVWLAARLLTWEQGVALLRREYLPTLSPELRERDERVIRLIEADLNRELIRPSGVTNLGKSSPESC